MCRWMWCRECAAAGDGVTAHVISDDGDEALGVGDCGFAGVATEGYDDDGGGVGGGECEKREPGSG